MPTSTLPTFTKDQCRLAHRLLAATVAHMMGRKFEEGDWASVYCAAKGIPLAGWSNLNIDVMHVGLGVEHKMLKVASDIPITTHCGTSRMHPAATRAVRIPDLNRDADQVMRDVFRQYAELIARRTDKVRETARGAEPDMRTGWLLWQESLREFLYFEEPMLAPDPEHYYAAWQTRASRGARLASKSLWIYERATGLKRFSVTTEAGIKIQPYFDVPPPTNQNLYLFTVQGEEVPGGLVRVWLTQPTHRDLETLLPHLDPATLSEAILLATPPQQPDASRFYAGAARELYVTEEAYANLVEKFTGASDEHRFRLLIESLRA